MQVMAPLVVQWHWCLYIWDFERKKIVVLDPKGMKLSKSRLEDKHNSFLMLMNSGMNECWDKFSRMNDNNFENWESEYIKIIGGEGNR